MALKYILLTLMICASFSVKAIQDQMLHVVTEHSPPFNYQLKNEEIVGSATEKVIKALNDSNIDFTLDIYPWARAYKLALTQPNTLIYSIYRNKERKDLFQWACPLLPRNDLYLYALKKNSSMKTVNIDNLKQFKTGIVRQGLVSTFLKGQGFQEGKELYVATDDTTNLKLLLEGKVDLVIATITSMKNRMEGINQALPLLRRINFPEINIDTELCLAFSLDTPSNIVDKVRIALHNINQTDA